jgi:hypothetical protein
MKVVSITWLIRLVSNPRDLQPLWDAVVGAHWICWDGPHKSTANLIMNIATVFPGIVNMERTYPKVIKGEESLN